MNEIHDHTMCASCGVSGCFGSVRNLGQPVEAIAKLRREAIMRRTFSDPIWLRASAYVTSRVEWSRFSMVQCSRIMCSAGVDWPDWWARTLSCRRFPSAVSCP